MSTDNQKQFNELADKILSILVDACPRQVELDANALQLDEGFFETTPGIIGGFYKATPEEEFLADTLQWLIAEGLIRAGAQSDHYVATLQALKLYGSVPNALTA